MNGIFNGILGAAVKGEVTPLDALLIALIGVSIVFAVLIVLMFAIWLMGFIVENSPKIAEKHPGFSNKMKAAKAKIAGIGRKKDESATLIEQPSAPAADEAVKTPAVGSFGELRLINTSERDAAMIMAIVADATRVPLNELRFISIKQIGEGEEK